MKKIIIAAATMLLCVSASAKVIATMPNKAGGEIKLTNVKCETRAGNFAYSTAESGRVLSGCWTVLDGEIAIRFVDGEYRIFRMRDFDLRDEVKPSKRSGEL